MTTPDRSLLSRQAVYVAFLILMLVGLGLSFAPAFTQGALDYLHTQVRRNSEAFAFAFLVAVDIHARSSDESRNRYGWWVFLVVVYVVTEVGAGLPGEIVTLSEAILAALLFSLILSWFTPASPLWSRRWLVPGVAAVLAIAGELPIGAWEGSVASNWLTDNAETLGFLMLGSILIGYVVSYPWPAVRSSRSTTSAWVLLLIATPAIVALINPHGVDSSSAVGISEEAMVWVQRITESFLAALLLTIYFWIQASLPGGPEGEGRLLEGKEPLHT